jgi:hypothetical protein
MATEIESATSPAARATHEAAATLTNEPGRRLAMYIGIGTLLAIVLIVLLLIYVF